MVLRNNVRALGNGLHNGNSQNRSDFYRFCILREIVPHGMFFAAMHVGGVKIFTVTSTLAGRSHIQFLSLCIGSSELLLSRSILPYLRVSIWLLRWLQE